MMNKNLSLAEQVADLDVIEKDLIQRRKDLSEAIKASQSEAQAIIMSNTDGHPVDVNHPADMIEGESDFDKYLQLGQRQKAELLQVDQALQRIKVGEFGICERCADDVPMNRLKAMPYARFCITCQKVLDAKTAKVPLFRSDSRV